MELAVQELEEYKKKCEFLQKQNTSLKSQLKSLRNVANNNAASIAIKPDPDFSPDVTGTYGADVDLDLDWVQSFLLSKEILKSWCETTALKKNNLLFWFILMWDFSIVVNLFC